MASEQRRRRAATLRPVRIWAESCALEVAGIVACLPLLQMVQTGRWLWQSFILVLVLAAATALARLAGWGAGRLAVLLLGLTALGTVTVAIVEIGWHTWASRGVGQVTATHVHETLELLRFGVAPIDPIPGLDVLLTALAGMVMTAITMLATSGSAALAGFAMVLPWVAAMPSDRRVSPWVLACEVGAFVLLLATFTSPRLRLASRRESLGAAPWRPVAPRARRGNWLRAAAVAVLIAVLVPLAMGAADNAAGSSAWRSVGDLGVFVRSLVRPTIADTQNAAGARGNRSTDLIGTVTRVGGSGVNTPLVARAYATTAFDGRAWQAPKPPDASRTDVTSSDASGRLETGLSSDTEELYSSYSGLMTTAQFNVELPRGAPGYLLLPMTTTGITGLSGRWSYDPVDDAATSPDAPTGQFSYHTNAFTMTADDLRWSQSRAVDADGRAYWAHDYDMLRQLATLPPLPRPATHHLQTLRKTIGDLQVMSGEDPTSTARSFDVSIFFGAGQVELKASGTYTLERFEDAVDYTSGGAEDAITVRRGEAEPPAELTKLLRSRTTARELAREAMYEVRSDLIEQGKDPSQYEQIALPTAAARPQARTVPPSVDPRVADFAAQVSKNATTDYERAVAIQAYLRDGDFRYDDTIAALPAGSDPVGTFLDTKRGYCLQFATTMAMMTRSLGMPTRLATGYLLETVTPDEKWRMVANKLHAWPEVFFQGVGWVRFEPTPSSQSGPAPQWAQTHVQPATPTTPATSAAPSTAGPSSRAVRTQAARPDDVGTALPGGEVTRRTNPGPALAIGAASAAIVALGGLAALWAARRRGALAAARARGRGAPPSEVAWARLEAAVRSRGIEWETSWTPHAAAVALEPLVSSDDARAALRSLALAVSDHRYAPVSAAGAASPAPTGAGEAGAEGAASGAPDVSGGDPARAVRLVIAALPRRRPQVRP